MQLEQQSPVISQELDTANGATSPVLYYHRGYLNEEGNKARWFAAQVTSADVLTIYRKTDFKGESITTASKVIPFRENYGFITTGTMNYVNRMSVNLHTNIIQQTAPTRLWLMYQVDWVEGIFQKNIDLTEIQPDIGSTIDYLSRYDNHLYFRVIDGLTNWWLYYVDLSNYGQVGTVLVEDSKRVIVKDETDFCAGEEYLYVIESGDLKIYPHGELNTPDIQENNIITDTTVEIREISNLELYVRASGVTLYRIELDATTYEATIISTALETDTEHFRVLIRGDLYVEGVEVTQTVNQADSHKDNWYIIGETDEINAYLSGIVQDICIDVDISSSDLDLSFIEEIIVQGFLMSSYTISDSYLKQLMIAYQFDRVESGGGIKFLKRGVASSQSVDSDRLGAITITNETDNNFPDRIGRTLEASRLIPKSFKIIYLEQQKDYDQTEQSIIRQDAQNRDQEIIDMSAFAWTDSFARQVADKVIALYFTEREQYTIFVSAYYYDIEPGDVVTLIVDDENTDIRITETMYGFPGVMQIQGLLENTEDFTSDVLGIASDTPAQSFFDFTEYQVIVLDVNLIFDTNADDINSGNYIVARSLGTTFNVADVLKSTQLTGLWNILSSISDEATVGNTLTSLGSSSFNIIDRANTVQVQISPSKTLSSITEDQLIDGGNLCAIGSEVNGYEILNFQNAIEIGSGDGIYELDTFIRGARGTENIINSHASADTFVLIESDKISNIVSDVNDIDTDYFYTAIELGDTIPENADDIEAYKSNLVNRRGLPFSVEHAKAIKNQSTNDITISWIRRARYSGEWLDFVDVPETDVTENYNIDILNAGTVIRTLTSTTNSVVYLSTLQVADFGSNISTLSCKIYKLHPTFGRGYVKELNTSV